MVWDTVTDVHKYIFTEPGVRPISFTADESHSHLKFNMAVLKTSDACCLLKVLTFTTFPLMSQCTQTDESKWKPVTVHKRLAN